VRALRGFLNTTTSLLILNVSLKPDLSTATVVDLNVVRSYRRLDHRDLVTDVTIHLTPVSARHVTYTLYPHNREGAPHQQRPMNF